MPSALAALRILDFSRVLAGPLATMVLGDLGAEVTKVERPGGGDETRSWGPPHDERGRATYFEAVNRNKSSIALDLADPSDRGRARELALAADVLVENFRPGVMAGFDLDHEALRGGNPGLVYCSITGFGSGEQGAALPGYDLLIQALGGLMSVTGEPGGPPLKVGVALVDVIAGLFAAVGILAALEHRHDSGRGQLVEVDLMSSLLAALVNQASAYTVAGEVPQRAGNRHPSIAPYELFDTAEGELVLAVGNDRQFAELCAAVGLDELAVDERFATNSGRVENREALTARLTAALTMRPAAEWSSLLGARRVPAGEVKDVGAAFRFAAAIGLDPIVSIPRGDGSSVELPRNPIRLSETPPSYRAPPPPPPGPAASPASSRRS
ncbi:MAG: CoA transferase [Solirubrobacterales bacterium]|nr:CoA transferase [Solirubrobacterales bacterium]